MSLRYAKFFSLKRIGSGIRRFNGVNCGLYEGCFLLINQFVPVLCERRFFKQKLPLSDTRHIVFPFSGWSGLSGRCGEGLAVRSLSCGVITVRYIPYFL